MAGPNRFIPPVSVHAIAIVQRGLDRDGTYLGHELVGHARDGSSYTLVVSTNAAALVRCRPQTVDSTFETHSPHPEECWRIAVACEPHQPSRPLLLWTALRSELAAAVCEHCQHASVLSTALGLRGREAFAVRRAPDVDFEGAMLRECESQVAQGAVGAAAASQVSCGAASWALK